MQAPHSAGVTTLARLAVRAEGSAFFLYFPCRGSWLRVCKPGFGQERLILRPCRDGRHACKIAHVIHYLLVLCRLYRTLGSLNELFNVFLTRHQFKISVINACMSWAWRACSGACLEVIFRIQGRARHSLHDTHLHCSTYKITYLLWPATVGCDRQPPSFVSLTLHVN